jgi:hypothetical protein
MSRKEMIQTVQEVFPGAEVVSDSVDEDEDMV